MDQEVVLLEVALDAKLFCQAIMEPQTRWSRVYDEVDTMVKFIHAGPVHMKDSMILSAEFKFVRVHQT